MPQPHRIAIIGIGAVAKMHATALAELPNATLVAGSCRTEVKGRQFAEQFGCAWHADYEQMLTAEKPDIVHICTPSGAHLEPVLACARRGIHVLCEKPIEISTQRIDQMIHAAKRGRILLGGIFPQRFNPVLQALRDAAAQNRFGHLAIVNCYVPWWRDDEYYAPQRWQGTAELDGGGALINQTSHMIDALQWLAGATMPYLSRGVNPVEEVFAFTATRGHDPGLLEVEDTAVGVVRFRNGAVGQILGATSMYPGSLRRIQVAGRDGTAEVAEDQLVTWRFRQEKDEDDATRLRYSSAPQKHGGGADPMAFDHANHARNFAAFLHAVETGKRPELDGIEARKAVAIIEAMYRSAEWGEAVRVK